MSTYNRHFVSDMQTIRERARDRMEQGAVIGDDQQTETVLALLDEALATEIICTLRYKNHYFTAEGVLAEAAKAEFLEHAREEQAHADQIAERITQLGGTPDLDPSTLIQRGHAKYGSAESLHEMIREDLEAERVAIQVYREMIRYIGDKDPTTRRMLEGILEQEEEHADDMAGLLEDGRIEAAAS